VLLAGAVLLAVLLAVAVLLAGESSRAMLASARLSCLTLALYKLITHLLTKTLDYLLAGEDYRCDCWARS